MFMHGPSGINHGMSKFSAVAAIVLRDNGGNDMGRIRFATVLALSVVLVACGGDEGGAAGSDGGQGTGKAQGPCILSHQEVIDALAPNPAVITESSSDVKGIDERPLKGACTYEGTVQSAGGSRAVRLFISTRVTDNDDTKSFALTVNQGKPVALGDQAASDSTGAAVMRLGGRYYRVKFSGSTNRTEESGATLILRAIAAKVK